MGCKNGVTHEILHNRDLELSKSFLIKRGRPTFEKGRPMWTKELRGHVDRNRLYYPGVPTIEEWASAEPLIASAKGGGSKPTMDLPSSGWSDSGVTAHPCWVGASHNQSAESSHGY